MTEARVAPINSALISVSDKTGVVPFAQALAAQGVKILSTGGTCRLLLSEGIPVTEVSDHTGFPEMMDGRVKTLHPKIHGGILGRRGTDDAVMSENAIDASIWLWSTSTRSNPPSPILTARSKTPSRILISAVQPWFAQPPKTIAMSPSLSITMTSIVCFQRLHRRRHIRCAAIRPCRKGF